MEFGGCEKYWAIPTSYSITLAALHGGGWLFFRKNGGFWAEGEAEPARPAGRAILLWCGPEEPPWRGSAYDAGLSLGDFLLVSGAQEDTHPQTTGRAARADAAWALQGAMALLESYRRAGPYETVFVGELDSQLCDEIREEAAGVIENHVLPSDKEECYRLAKNLHAYALYLPGFRGYEASPGAIKEVCAEAGRRAVGDFALPLFEEYEGPLLQDDCMFGVAAEVLAGLVDRVHYREQEKAVLRAFPAESRTWGEDTLLRAAYTRIVAESRRAESHSTAL